MMLIIKIRPTCIVLLPAIYFSSSAKYLSMELTISAPGLALQEPLLDDIRKQFEHLQKKFHPARACSVVLKRNAGGPSGLCSVEANVQVPGKTMHARNADTSFEGSVHRVLDKLERQLGRYAGEREEIW